MYTIGYDEQALDEIACLRVFERRRIVDAIEAALGREPARPSKRRKELKGLVPPWDQVRPVWQLRVGDFRVFYDVDPAARTVIVRAVRRKGNERTEDIL